MGVPFHGSLAGWGKRVWRMKNGFISQVIPKTVTEDRLSFKCQIQGADLDDLPLVPCKRNPDTRERIADGSSAPFLPVCSSPFWSNSSLHSEVWGLFFFFLFSFKSFNDKKTSEACCKLKILNVVETQMIPRKIIQILLRFFFGFEVL